MEESKNDFGRIKSRPRSKKLNSKVDLTAMVSISFLLIAFYMVRIELSKPKAMNLGLMDKIDDGTIRCYGCGFLTDNRRLTLLLDDNNSIVYFRGFEENAKRLTYGKNGIRKELLKASKRIATDFGPNKGAIVIIKPTKKTTFKNLVDILDEMAITDIQTYAIVNELSPEEMNLIASN